MTNTDNTRLPDKLLHGQLRPSWSKLSTTADKHYTVAVGLCFRASNHDK